jgi:4,5-dihydroxyphthalate decarboxylase
MEDLLKRGEIPAAIGVQIDSPDVQPLIPNAREAGFAALRARGLYPINHTVVIRNDVLDANPNLARDLFDAFVQAKQHYLQRLAAGRADGADPIHARVMDSIGDPLPYGMEPNRKMLDAIVQYSVEQGILSKPFSADELFARV